MDWSTLVGLGEPRIESCRLAFRRLSGVVDECMEAPTESDAWVYLNARIIDDVCGAL